jgi:hypothetical protein
MLELQVKDTGKDISLRFCGYEYMRQDFLGFALTMAMYES